MCLSSNTFRLQSHHHSWSTLTAAALVSPQDKPYSEAVMLIYDGIHYDALAVSE